MVPDKRLIQSVGSKWKWMLHCWFLREPIQDLVRAFSSSPTHVQVQKLESEKEELGSKLAESNKAVEELRSHKVELEQAHRIEVAALKSKYEKRIHATQTDQVEAIKNELMQERDAKHLLKIELQDLRTRIEKEAEAHKLSRDGNLALLRFIHTGHRLNVKFDADSIRGALRRANGG